MGLRTKIELMKACEIHRGLLLKWANDPDVRKMAFNQKPITWEEHSTWFDKKLKDSRCFIYIAYYGVIPIGQIRFDILEDNPKKAETDVSIASFARGEGFGTEIIKLGVKKLFKEGDIDIVCAVVKGENTASLSAFKSAGFKEFRGGKNSYLEIKKELI